MGTPPSSLSQLDVQSKAMSRNTRQSIRLRRLTLRTLDQPKPTVNIDATTSQGSGPHKEKFHNYLGNTPQTEDPPSPIERHVKWKLARTKRYGQMISQAAQEISNKIDSLEEQTTHGTFVPHGRDDILNTTIERLDHGGCVRVVGSGVTISQYFGRTSRTSSSSSTSITQQQLAKS
ncbi:hypothetical protein GmHk_20G056838 [Glycine max]|nr:hypothetical protein GmHk_20G056838 [Glycine max]KAH1188966.1 hypothetical protein GmHk_20G056838 [Glycine max]